MLVVSLEVADAERARAMTERTMIGWAPALTVDAPAGGQDRHRRWVVLLVAVGLVQGVLHIVNSFTFDHSFLDVNAERRPFAVIQGFLIGAASVGAFAVTARGLVGRPVGLALGAVL